MGSAASAACETPGGDLRLPHSGLRFTVNQLRALNAHVEELWEEDQRGRMSKETETMVENLVQRIVDGAGQRDPRFKCRHLIALHRGKKMRSRSLEYLVTLDALPVLDGSNEECQLEEGPYGYGKIRLTGREADKWEEFLTPSGYLCRDKVVERWVCLVARGAGGRAARAGACRVLGAGAHALARDYSYCYLETAHGGAESPPGRRLAIVEGAAWVMVRAGDAGAEAKLVLGAACGAAPGARPPPLTHPLALLHYAHGARAHVAAAPPPAAPPAGPERGAAWRVWRPALRHALDDHLHDLAPPALLAAALNAALDRMRHGHYQGSAPTLSRYLVWCVWRRRLDRCGEYPTAAGRAFLSAHLSHHLLLALDELVAVCEAGGPALGYEGPGARDHLTRRGARPAWARDAACLRAVLLQLAADAGKGVEAPAPGPSERLEAALAARWEGVWRGAGAGGAGAAAYSARQLHYLAALCRRVAPAPAGERTARWLGVVLSQARDEYLGRLADGARGDDDRDLHAYRTKKWSKLRQYYDASAACLEQAARREGAEPAEDAEAARAAVAWSARGARADPKYLGPVLRPFLARLYQSSLEAAWFADSLLAGGERGECGEPAGGGELAALRSYCAGVHAGVLAPAAGLEAAAQAHCWAKVLLDYLDRHRHVEYRLVFPGGAGLEVPISGRAGRARRALSAHHKQRAKGELARRAVTAAYRHALIGHRMKQTSLPRQDSSEILTSAKNGNYWRNNSKPDVIPSAAVPEPAAPRRRRSRGSRPHTAHGFPAITLSDDTHSLRDKYHTLRSLMYREGAEREARGRRPRSAGGTLRGAEPPSRPALLETLDFIRGVRDEINVESSCGSEAEEGARGGECSAAPLEVARRGAGVLGLALGDVVPALLRHRHYSVLQELSVWLGGAREGALFALHRLARAHTHVQVRAEPPQLYRRRPSDPGPEPDRPPPPPPLPRRSSKDKMALPKYADYLPPPRIQPPPQDPPAAPAPPYTGIINPIYEVKLPRDKFAVKRSKSLGRSFSTKSKGGEGARYNVSLGARGGARTNDVLTALGGGAGLASNGHFFQRRPAAPVVGDSYRPTRVTID